MDGRKRGREQDSPMKAPQSLPDSPEEKKGCRCCTTALKELIAAPFTDVFGSKKQAGDPGAAGAAAGASGTPLPHSKATKAMLSNATRTDSQQHTTTQLRTHDISQHLDRQQLRLNQLHAVHVLKTRSAPGQQEATSPRRRIADQMMSRSPSKHRGASYCCLPTHSPKVQQDQQQPKQQQQQHKRQKTMSTPALDKAVAAAVNGHNEEDVVQAFHAPPKDQQQKQKQKPKLQAASDTSNSSAAQHLCSSATTTLTDLIPSNRLPKPITDNLRALVKAQSHLKRLMIDTHQDLSLPKSALGINYLAADGSPELRLAGSGTFASVFLTAVQPPPVHRRPGFLTERRLYAYKVLQLPPGIRAARFFPDDFNARAAACGHGYPHTKSGLTKQMGHLRYLTFFIRECEALILCKAHPNIVTVHGFCLDDTKMLPTIVMDYAGESNLWDVLFSERRRKGRELSWEQACSILIQLLDAIDYMHYHLPRDAFVIHRDISPGNVMIAFPDSDPDGQPHVTLVDLGLAEVKTPKDCPSEGPYEWVQEGVSLGPELRFIDPIMKNEKLYGRGTDIFGFGALTMLLLYGKPSVLNSDKSLPEKVNFQTHCAHRNSLRHQLYTETVEDLLSGGGGVEVPLHARWSEAPPQLISTLMTLACECTMSIRPKALSARPSSAHCIEEFNKCKISLPSRLVDLIPQRAATARCLRK